MQTTFCKPFIQLTACDAYIAAAIADFIREQLLIAGESFSFETVMSHQSKVEFLNRARRAGYRTYLHFIATETPWLNIRRVDSRVEQGGHSVPEDKIRERYDRCLHLLENALGGAYRGFIFDNSGNAPLLLAELNPHGKLELKVEKSSLPNWFTTHVSSRFQC